MFNLVLKEFIIQKKAFYLSIIFTMLYSLCLPFITNNDTTLIFVTGPAFITYTLLMYACSYDDKNKSEIMLNSLSISRMDIVLAKYISVFVYLIIGIAVSIISAVILYFVKNIEFNIVTARSIIAGCSAGSILLGCIFLPVYFKFGYTKSRYFNMILFMCAFFIPPLLIKSLSKGSSAQLLTYIINQPNWAVYSIVLTMLFLIVVLSAFISMIIYLNKDL